MTKKILHIIPSANYSGAESVAITIIEKLQSEYDFCYSSFQGTTKDILKEKNIKFLSIDKMNVKEVKRVLNEYKPDIIHAHDYRASCICALATKEIPIISHLHNNAPWIKTLHPFSFLYLFCSRRFKKILTVSDSIEKEYIFSKHIKNKIECIGNPVSVEKIVKMVDCSEQEKKYDLCCVARITEAKNPYKFLDVLQKLKKSNSHIKAVWVGDGDLLQNVQEKVRELELEENIDFVGFKRNPYKYMASSKVFVLTSNWEGYGLVAFEAMSLGLPSVVSNVGGLPNIVDDHCGKLCTSTNDFCEEIELLLTDEKEYSKKSAKAKEKALQLDNIDKYIAYIKKSYDELK